MLKLFRLEELVAQIFGVILSGSNAFISEGYFYNINIIIAFFLWSRVLFFIDFDMLSCYVLAVLGVGS